MRVDGLGEVAIHPVNVGRVRRVRERCRCPRVSAGCQGPAHVGQRRRVLPLGRLLAHPCQNVCMSDKRLRYDELVNTGSGSLYRRLRLGATNRDTLALGALGW